MGISVVDTIELKANRTIDVLENGLTYYNYEGNHFRVFSSKENAIEFIESNNNNLVIAEFDNEDDLDEFLEKYEIKQEENLEEAKNIVAEHQAIIHTTTIIHLLWWTNTLLTK